MWCRTCSWAVLWTWSWADPASHQGRVLSTSTHLLEGKTPGPCRRSGWAGPAVVTVVGLGSTRRGRRAFGDARSLFVCPRWVSGGASPAQDRRGQVGTGQVLGQIFVRASSCLWSHPREALGTQLGQEECQGARNAACMRCHQRPDRPGLGAEPFGWSLVGAGAPGLGDLPRALPLHSASFRGLPPCPKYPARMGFFPAAVDSFTTCVLPPALGGFPFPPVLPAALLLSPWPALHPPLHSERCMCLPPTSAPPRLGEGQRRKATELDLA